MYVKTEKGREHYKCEKCGKAYSYKVGRKTNYWMRCYCKEHAYKERMRLNEG